MIHFHKWGRWESSNAKQWWHWSDGTSTSTPVAIQSKVCSKCGKRKVQQLG